MKNKKIPTKVEWTYGAPISNAVARVLHANVKNFLATAFEIVFNKKFIGQSCFYDKYYAIYNIQHTKAELLQEGILFLIHLFARDILLMKKLEIKKTKPTFIISFLKVE